MPDIRGLAQEGIRRSAQDVLFKFTDKQQGSPAPFSVMDIELPGARHGLNVTL